MNKHRIVLTLEGPCTMCGEAASTHIDVVISDSISMETKDMLSKKQDVLLKEINTLMCDECFLATTFGLSPELVQEVVNSTSSEIE